MSEFSREEFSREEQLLRRALEKRQPRAGFAERVLARLPETQAGERRSWWEALFAMPRWAPALALLLVAILGGGALEYRREYQREYEKERLQRRLRAEAVQVELFEAMQITSAKMHETTSRAFRRGRGGVL